jgi:hypothetical protein
MSSNGKLNRKTFRTSREMDFFSEKELVTQTGHEKGDWALVIIKELMDNALDACETASVAPVINVTADPSGITVADNGPGLPETTLQGALKFTIRVSDKEAYVSPCRGAQGNALKTLLPMPGVLDPDGGRFIVQAHGKRHVITCGADPISHRPLIKDDVSEEAKCTNRAGRNGTKMGIEWTERSDGYGLLWPFVDCCNPGDVDGYDCDLARRLRELVEGFALFNPHATIRLDWFKERTVWKATDPGWQKWRPCDPTSPHWYKPAHFERLIGAYITDDREAGIERWISEFIDEFDGLTRSQKRAKVLNETGLKRVRLSDLVVNDRLDSKRIAKLLEAMRRHTRPVKPAALGIIGEDHLRKRLLAMGVKPESFRYKLKLDPPKGKIGNGDSILPSVLETAFGWLGAEAEDRRRIYTGANWSAAIKNPFRSFGATGEGLENQLADLRATRHQPVVFVIHAAQPRIEYLDRGKSGLVVAE